MTGLVRSASTSILTVCCTQLDSLLPVPSEGMEMADSRRRLSSLIRLHTMFVALTVGLILRPANAQSCSWVTATPMPTARSGAAVGTVNGIIYVIGGRQGGTPLYLGTNEAYDPATNSWSPKAPMPTPRSFDGTNGAVLGGKIYCVGGTASSTPFCTVSGCTNIVEVYDPANDTWATAGPLPSARCAPAVVAINGLLYVFGGYTCWYSTAGGGITYSWDTVDVYDPATSSWTSCGAMPLPRTF